MNKKRAAFLFYDGRNIPHVSTPASESSNIFSSSSSRPAVTLAGSAFRDMRDRALVLFELIKPKVYMQNINNIQTVVFAVWSTKVAEQ